MQKKIISFSLWGNDEKYTIGAIENAKLAMQIYPEWICRYYTGQSTLRMAPEVVKELKSFPNTEIIIMSDEGDWTGMFWRFTACSDADVEYILCRDCDSRISLREKGAVLEWMKSGKAFHIMKDHPWHKGLVILGGLWGARADSLRDMNSLIHSYDKMMNAYNADQEFLAKMVYPRIKDDCLIHDEFNGGRKFPSRRWKNEFVGQVFDPDNIRTGEHKQAIEFELKKNSSTSRIKDVVRNLLIFLRKKP